MGGERVANFYFAKNIQNKTNLLSSTLTDVSIILKRANDWKSCVPTAPGSGWQSLSPYAPAPSAGAALSPAQVQRSPDKCILGWNQEGNCLGPWEPHSPLVPPASNLRSLGLKVT